VFFNRRTDEHLIPKQNRISAELKNITLREALQEIEKNSDYLFLVMDNTADALSAKVD